MNFNEVLSWKITQSAQKTVKKILEGEPYPLTPHHMQVLTGAVNTLGKKRIIPNNSSDIKKLKALARTIVEDNTRGDFSWSDDTLGPKMEGRREFINGLTAAMVIFFSLEDEHPVIASREMLDIICRSCFIGKHCTEEEFSSGQRDWILKEEDEYLRHLYKASGQPPPTKRTPIICQTSAGVVRKLLG